MGNLTPQKSDTGFNASVEEKISQLIAAMPHVEAPGDFGFRVKAKIAEARPVNSRPLWLPTAIKAAVPLGLVLAIGGYVGVTSFYVKSEPPVEQAIVEPVRPGLVQSVPAAPVPQTPTVSPVAEQIPQESAPTLARANIRENAARIQPRKPLIKKSEAEKDSGDFVDAVKPAQSPTVPVDPENKVETIKGTPAGEILTKIGVNALFGESGWKAESVSPNTAAAKAGVQAGDIIESVDDQDMTDLGSVAKPAKGKKLKVKREGKSVEIVID